MNAPDVENPKAPAMQSNAEERELTLPSPWPYRNDKGTGNRLERRRELIVRVVIRIIENKRVRAEKSR
jgi:hypothetical protein